MNSIQYTLLVSLFFISLPVFSLTLGNVKVNSYVNQHLDAKIEVKSSGNLQLDKVKAFLASKADFQKYDIERESFLDDIRFVTYQEKSGKNYIHLTSTKLMREPLISLVVNLRTVEGNISREYNLFLSPSPFTQGKQIPLTKRKILTDDHNASLRNNISDDNQFIDNLTDYSENTLRKTKNIKITKSSLVGIYRPDLNYSVEKYQAISSYGPIKSGNVLSQIAQDIRPDDSYSIQKISTLLYQYNPDAFINTNINKLKIGAVLRIPDLNKPEFRKTSFAYLDNSEQENSREEQLKPILDTSKSSMTATTNLKPDEERDTSSNSAINDAQLTLMTEENTVNNQKLINELELDKQAVENKLFIDLSITKMKELKDENRELLKQFDIVMVRMEELIAKNKTLDKEISLLKSAKDNMITPDKTDDSLKPAELNGSRKSGFETEVEVEPEEVEVMTTHNKRLVKKDNRNISYDWLPFFLGSVLILLFLSLASIVIKRYRSKRENIQGDFSLDHALDDVRDKNKSEQDKPNKVEAEKDAIKTGKNKVESIEIEAVIDESDNFTHTEDDHFDFNLDIDESHLEVKNSDISVPGTINSNSLVEQGGTDIDEFNLGDSFKKSNDKASLSNMNSISGVSNKKVEVKIKNTVANASGINFNDVLGVSTTVKSNASVDLISQSSVYFAYGKFDLAEKLLVDGIRENPELDELKLKLFECYAKLDDESKFLSYLEQVKEKYSSNKSFSENIKEIYLNQWGKELY